MSEVRERSATLINKEILCVMLGYYVRLSQEQITMNLLMSNAGWGM